MTKISAIVLTKNEEQMITACLESLSFCDEIIIIDSHSTDDTLTIAKKKSAKIYLDDSADFSSKRNLGLKHATHDWVLYVDADERISEELGESIKYKVSEVAGNFVAYKMKRKNFYLGEHAWPQIEYMERLFKKSALKGWVGALHESPQVTGTVGLLEGDLLHYTHRTLTGMVNKTNHWSETEAALRFHTHHPKMTWWRFPRVMMTAFYTSYITQGGWRVGTAGLIESMYQAFSAFITYAKLWEMQTQKIKKA